MSSFTKVAVTMPTATFRALEKARAKLGHSRSAAVARALEEWLRGLDAAEQDRRYVEGYLRKPENLEEIVALTRAGTASWSEWSPGKPLRAAEPRRRKR